MNPHPKGVSLHYNIIGRMDGIHVVQGKGPKIQRN